MKTKQKEIKSVIFKIFTYFAGGYHIILGLSALLLPPTVLVKVIKFLLGFSPIADEQFYLIAKFVGVYALVFGVMLYIYARNPIKYQALKIPVLMLYGIRLLNKLIFFAPIAALYNIPLSRNIFGIFMLALFFSVIWLTAPKK